MRRVINAGAFSVDLGKLVDEAIERQQLHEAVDGLEDRLRRGDLSA